MKNTDDSRYEEKSSCATAKSTLFTVNKYEWDTKEETGRSMKNASNVLQLGMPKGTSWAELMLNSENNQAHSLSHYQVTLV